MESAPDGTRVSRAPRILVNAFGAYHGGIVRVHNSVCQALLEVGPVDVANAPRDQDEALPVHVLTRQTDSRLRSFVRDAIAARTTRSYDIRVDPAPGLRLRTRSGLHVVIVHDLNFLHPSIHRISWKQRLYRVLLHRWTLKRADRIVVDSEVMREELAVFSPAAAARARVLPLPVDHLEPFAAAVPGIDPPDAPVRLLSFGHARNKGVDHLLALLAARSDLELTVICPQQTWTDLWERRATDLGVEARVRVLSDLSDEDLVREYRSAAVFCMVSSYEGYGLPVAEALYLARPVVITDLPVLRSTGRGMAVRAEGVTANALGAAVDQALSLPDTHWKQAAAEVRSWTWRSWVARMLEPDGPPSATDGAGEVE